MRVIIIIIVGATSMVPAIAAVAALFLFIFSQDGDRTPGAVNTVQYDIKCYPSVKAYVTMMAQFDDLNRRRVKYSLEAEDKVLRGLGIVRLEKGADVTVAGGGVGYYPHGQLQMTFTPVQLTEGPQNMCFVDSRALEMEFGEWAKWKWDNW